jgi:hypothetical protein
MCTKIVLLTAVILSGQVFAEAADAKKEVVALVDKAKPAAPILTKGQEALKYMKEKFSVSYHGEYYLARRLPYFENSTDEKEKDIQDLHIMHNPTLIYKPTNNWQLLATAEFKYSDRPNYIYYPNSFYRSLFTVTRKNILTEEGSGIQLDAGIGRRQFNTGLAAIHSYGNNRIFTTVSKKFNKHSGSLFLQYLQNDYKHPTMATWKHGLEIIPTINLRLTEKLTWLINDDIVINLPNDQGTARNYYISHDMNIGYFNYQWNDKVGTYYQLKYLHARYDFTKNYQSDYDSFENYLGISYAYNSKMAFAAEIGSEVFRSGDRKDFFSEKVRYPELAFYVDISL